MKALSLPPRRDGTRLSLPPSARRVLIIGANGSGKTRFARHFASEQGDNAEVLSALNAIFGHDTSSSSFSNIDRLYDASVASSAIERPATRFEKLFALLMHDEMVHLLDYKLRRSSDPSATLGETVLDKVISIWHDIFPDNRILVESGRLLFSRGFDSDPYSPKRLSTGEKTVLYYITALMYAPASSIVFVDNPDLFLHPSVLQNLWNRLESERADCVFVYTTHDLEFAGSRTGATTVWVRDYDVAASLWDYDILPSRQGIPDEVYMAILGSRKPIIFIEGDAEHSIDAKFYPLIFCDYSVRSMGSCNKVIEATRSFNDLAAFHHLDSHGIVDRDRRDDKEVEYLRRKKIFVPDVAEIENILMLEEVVRTVATHCGKREDYVFGRVRDTIIKLFRSELRQQALQHTRHRMKRFMECRIDGRFSDIAMLERHLDEVVHEFNARGLYERYCRDFHRYAETADYSEVLRVFNQKTMVPASGVAQLCGMTGGKEQYVATVINLLRHGGKSAERIRTAVLRCFGIGRDEKPSEATLSEPDTTTSGITPVPDTHSGSDLSSRHPAKEHHDSLRNDETPSPQAYDHKRHYPRWRPRRRKGKGGARQSDHNKKKK